MGCLRIRRLGPQDLPLDSRPLLRRNGVVVQRQRGLRRPDGLRRANENDGDPVVVTSESAFSFGGIRFPGGQAVRAVESQGTWTLSEAPGCSSTAWVPVASGLVDPVAVPSSLQASATLSQVLTICEHDGVDLPVRGTVEAYDVPGGAVTLSILPLEEYVRSVISAEVSWSWGLFGGRTRAPQGHEWGFQALEAQAVATRRMPWPSLPRAAGRRT